MGKFSYDVCVVGGLGHIGLPLGISFAKVGKKVILYDINKDSIDTVSKGKMPFSEVGAEKPLQETINKTLFISSDRNVISQSHFVILTIGTPIDEHLNPQFTLFKKFFDEIIFLLNDQQHIIIRSTVYPGTTEKITELLRQNGKKTRVSFCPERIAEGKAIEEVRSLPQIIAAFDDDSIREASELFLNLTTQTIPLKPIEAELAKLYTNVWRYLQFAISNQFYQIAVQNNLDFYKIFDAVTNNYPRTKGFAKAGFAAGPCLFKDTMQLAAFANNSFFLGHAAMLINEGLPNFIVQKLKEKHNLKTKVVGILGMAFKGDSDDSRESLSYKLKKVLTIEAAQVLCSDSHVKDATLVPVETLIKKSDIIIIGATHSEYKKLKLDFSSKTVVDMWNFFGLGGIF
ncbi:MAG: nucleotide sugar dehydrogenase [Phycisphaerae bacterium]|nr:nucleotide sugar dehydrogenase [Phycisphaerae bacterium]MDD5380792.1 nucleotide sugar dehydrogenase [Phycisphaerae bacterium]